MYDGDLGVGLGRIGSCLCDLGALPDQKKLTKRRNHDNSRTD